jgi:type IV secretion system protein VirB10
VSTPDPIHGERVQNTMPSVNSRGPGPGNPLGKVIFVIGVVGLLLVAGVYGYNHVRASRAAAAEVAKQSGSKNVSKPAAAGILRDFDKDQTADPPEGASAASPPTTTGESLCKDGTNGVPAIGLDNQQLVSAQGVPERICADGQLVVPEIQRTAQPIALAAARTQEASGSRPSRYAGDAMLPSSGTAPIGGIAGNTAMPTLPANPAEQAAYLASMLRQPLGSLTGAADAGAANGKTAAAGALGSQLTPTSTARVSASMIGDRNMLLPKGRSIDCGLTMRLESDLPGLATCVLSQNIFSDNGKVLLLERGSQAVGEYGANMAQGQRRIFVLWTRIETPSGVVINLDSPGADELGTSGLAGRVNNHWWERLGAATLLTLVQDAVGYETAKASNGNAGSYAVLQNTAQSSNNMADLVLQSTIGIKPTLYKNQGDRATIFVARDLDFGSVYGLNPR